MRPLISFFFFFNDTATTEIYTLSLHDALPICRFAERPEVVPLQEHRVRIVQLVEHPIDRHLIQPALVDRIDVVVGHVGERSEEHTSELQSRLHLVCRLLLEKKKTTSLAAMRIF